MSTDFEIQNSKEFIKGARLMDIWVILEYWL
jgi:hypothetical protein